MKQKYFSLVVVIFLLTYNSLSNAQCLGTPGTAACRCYFPGHYVEVGINNTGAFGAQTPPSGYHPYIPGPLAEVYDYGHDGWTTGTPPYYGDYTYPGSPFEGWELQVGTTTTDVSQCFTSGTASTISGSAGHSLIGNLDTTSYSNSGGVISVIWRGTAWKVGSTRYLNVTQITSIDTNGSAILVTTKFNNTNTTTASPQMYYMRSCDPDNDEARGGSFSTDNVIVHQNENADHDVEVDAEGTTFHDIWSLATKDCRARAFIYSSWSLSSTVNLSTVWDTTYDHGGGGGAEYSKGVYDNGDIAIGLVFNLCSIPAGDSAEISYGYIFHDTFSSIDIAFPDPELDINNVLYDSAGTITVCAYPIGTHSVPVSIAHGNSGVWTWGQWNWAPNTALSSDTGVNQSVNVDALGGPITYTITGTTFTNGAACSAACGQKILYLTVIPCFSAHVDTPCQGNPLHLTSFPPDSLAAYAWYNPAGVLIGTTQLLTIDNAAPSMDGLYMTVRTVASSDSGTSSDTAYAFATVRPLPIVVDTSDAPICSGTPLFLQALGDSVNADSFTFAWIGPKVITDTTTGASYIVRDTLSNSDTFNVPVSIVNNSGLYAVYTSLNGCYDSAFINIIVDSLPLPPLVSNNAAIAICSDSTLYLYASLPDSAAGTVNWLWVGPNGFSSTLQNPVIPDVSIAAYGTYTVTATLGTAPYTCSSLDTTAAVINPTPPLPILTTPPPICSGSTLYLYATDTPGAVPPPTYSWTGPNGFVSAAQNPYITGATTAASGLYSVTATLFGCPSSVAWISALVDSTPLPVTVSVDTLICQHDTLQLFAADSTAGVIYSWTGPLSFSSTLQNPFIYNVPVTASGSYFVTATLASSASTLSSICSVSNSIFVNVRPVPALVSVSSTSPVCSQGDLTLLASFTPDLGAQYNWAGPAPYSFTAINDQYPVISDIPTNASGTYSVAVTLNGCTSDTATVNVVVDSTPLAPLVFSNSVVCQHDTLKLFAADSTDSVTYAWFGPHGFSSIQQNPYIANVDTTADGVYSVSALLGMCATASQTTVSVTATPSFVPTSNSPVCSGDTLKLHANGVTGSGYSWAGPYAFYAASVDADPLIGNVTSENAGIYTVTATFNNCPTSEFDTVVVNTIPAPPFVSWLTYCQFYAAPPLMATGENITWYATDVLTAGTTTPPVPNTAVVGATFYYAAQVVNECSSLLDSIQVTINPTPHVTVSTADTGVCPHSSFLLTAVDTDAVANYQWIPSMYLGDANTDTVTVSPETDITYDVIASNQYGCSDTDTVHIVVYPAALVSLPDSVTLYPGETYTITPSSNCTSFSWFPSSGLSGTTIPDPVANPAVSTKYIVEAKTDNGCTTTDSISINLSASSLLALPNAFTPGNGPNNEFRVIKKGEASLSYFRIFDRWGQKVFETTDINAGWDGTFKGSAQPLGVYIYEIEAVASNGQNFILQGNVTLLR